MEVTRDRAESVGVYEREKRRRALDFLEEKLTRFSLPDASAREREKEYREREVIFSYRHQTNDYE